MVFCLYITILVHSNHRSLPHRRIQTNNCTLADPWPTSSQFNVIKTKNSASQLSKRLNSWWTNKNYVITWLRDRREEEIIAGHFPGGNRWLTLEDPFEKFRVEEGVFVLQEMVLSTDGFARIASVSIAGDGKPHQLYALSIHAKDRCRIVILRVTGGLMGNPLISRLNGTWRLCPPRHPEPFDDLSGPSFRH